MDLPDPKDLRARQVLKDLRDQKDRRVLKDQPV
jgi:hypothetical protein